MRAPWKAWGTIWLLPAMSMKPWSEKLPKWPSSTLPMEKQFWQNINIDIIFPFYLGLLRMDWGASVFVAWLWPAVRGHSNHHVPIQAPIGREIWQTTHQKNYPLQVVFFSTAILNIIFHYNYLLIKQPPSCAHIVSAKAPDQQLTKRQLTHKNTHGKHRLKTVHISPVTSLQCGVESSIKIQSLTSGGGNNP